MEKAVRKGSGGINFSRFMIRNQSEIKIRQACRVLLAQGYFADFLFHLAYMKNANGELKPAGVMYRFGEKEQGQVAVPACFSSSRTAKTAPEHLIVKKARVGKRFDRRFWRADSLTSIWMKAKTIRMRKLSV